MASSIFVLPLVNTPQQFELELAGVSYLVTCKWNAADGGGWVLDFADSITLVSIACNIPLVTGVDLLAGLEYLAFGGSLYVYTDGDSDATPTLDNLGVESNVYFVTDVEDNG